MNNRKIAEQIFIAGIRRVHPGRLITDQIKISGPTLSIGQIKIQIDKTDNIYIIGAGKASGAMAAEAEKILGSRITDGHVVVKYGHGCKLKHIKISEAGHPLPDLNSFKAADEIIKIANKASMGDLVICLLSGGGSSLLADYPTGSSPEEMITVNDILIKSGASINEMNIIRKHLSSIKGGQLAKVVFPAALVTLILSDVIGDPPDSIASGPTAPDNSTFGEAVAILRKYSLLDFIPEGALNYLMKGEQGEIPETPKPGDRLFERTYNMIVGSNKIALEASKKMAEKYGMNTFIIDCELHGDSAKASEYIVETALSFMSDNNIKKPVCLLFGGETTLTVSGSGTGGRNQHIALAAAILLLNHPGITILSAGTDGTDGPTEAAGGIVDSETVSSAISKKLDPYKFLTDYDSYNFFKSAGGHFITGPTLTNVMDMVVVIVE